MASDLRGYTEQEVLNKVLNTSNDSIKVDIVAGAEYAEDAEHSSGDTGQFVLGVRSDSLSALGANGDYVPFQMNASGALYVDVADGGQLDTIIDTLETTLTAIETDAAAIEVLLTAANVDHAANEVLLTGIDADTDAIKTSLDNIDNAVDGNYLNVNANIAGTDFVGGAGAVASGVQRVTLASDDPAVTDLAAIEVLLTAANVDHAANEVLLTGIDADTNAIKVDMAAIEVLLTAANVDHAANEALLTTIDSDTDAIKTATEASQASLADMIYGTAVAIDIDSGNHGSLTHNALYVGTGGNVKVNMATGGTGITFSNVASGQILPIQITQVWQSGTTAEDMVALKE